ncbi:C-terminal processing peptidase [Enterococcus durans]|uniref:C-terminal processing peptidase n=1 Tax=Enterococcus durans TaxID=53345 RepID=A0A377KML3_9ENTE|nr:S41 family peptidase [Enterococcus durans]STP30223.1 C-terminal processing peptidase [Enterococcus durans]
MLRKIDKNKWFVFISGIVFFLLGLCTLVLFLPSYLKKETRGIEAVQFVANHGMIENREEWEEILEKTNYGRNIDNIDYLNYVLYTVNKHSSAFKFEYNNPRKTEIVPTKRQEGHFTVITIPSIYTENTQFVKKYVHSLSDFIKDAKQNIVLDLITNSGGSREPMIMGIRSLIPDGIIFNEIDNRGNTFPLVLKNNQLIGGIPGDLWTSINSFDFPIENKIVNKKIAVLTSERTASAAENLLLALKKNEHVKVFREATAGLTTLNTNFFLENPNSKDLWEIVCSIGYLERNNGTTNASSAKNFPIEPDIKNSFPLLNKENTELIRQLNQWFKE